MSAVQQSCHRHHPQSTIHRVDQICRIPVTQVMETARSCRAGQAANEKGREREGKKGREEEEGKREEGTIDPKRFGTVPW